LLPQACRLRLRKREGRGDRNWLRDNGGLTLDKKSHLAAALVQAGALLINHIAPGNRTLAPSA
jgi:hypothetical protein